MAICKMGVPCVNLVSGPFAPRTVPEVTSDTGSKKRKVTQGPFSGIGTVQLSSALGSTPLGSDRRSALAGLCWLIAQLGPDSVRLGSSRLISAPTR